MKIKATDTLSDTLSDTPKRLCTDGFQDVGDTPTDTLSDTLTHTRVRI